MRLAACPRGTCSPPVPSCSARAARCCWCTARSTTTGRSPRASSTPASTPTAAAVREVAEETGLRVRLGVAAGRAALPDGGGRTKTVVLLGRPGGRRRRRERLRGQRRDRRGRLGRRSTRRCERLTYHARPRRPCEALKLRRRTHAAGRAAPRPGPLPQGAGATTTGCRPLLAAGQRAGPARWCRCSRRTASTGVVTSSSTRCVDTVRAVRRAHRRGRSSATDGLSEEDATAESVLGLVDDLLHGRRAAPCCARTGRCCPWSSTPRRRRPRSSSPGEMLVVHHRKGRVVATERHQSAERPSRTPSAPGLVHVIAVSVPPGRRRPGSPQFTPVHRGHRSVHLRCLRSGVSPATRRHSGDTK